jgi:hypothetical protein
VQLTFRVTRKRLVMLVVAAALVTAGGIAYAAIPDGNGIYTACKLNALGTIRLIDPSGPPSSPLSRCSALETKISWNQGGPTGAPGDKGPAGDKGPVGDQGAPGDKGPGGDKGLTGDKGPGGDTGAPGDKGLVGDKGPNGDPGAAGDKGATGDKGPAGDPGAKGVDGDKGLAGDKGPAGDKGDKGPIGDKGPTGDPGPAGTGTLWALWRDSSGGPPVTSSGVSVSRLRTGVYAVSFPRAVRACAVSIDLAQYAHTQIAAGFDPPDVPRIFSVYGDVSSNQTLRVGERLPNGDLTDGPFSITVTC